MWLHTVWKQMTMALAEHGLEKFNVFPAKHGMSEFHSLETIVTGNAMNCNEHCQCEFSRCEQAHHERKKH